MSKGEDNTALVNVVNADVLLTFEEDTVINMQMIAFPKLIRYYADEDAFDDVVNIHAQVKELRKGRVRLEDIKNSDGTEAVDEFYPFISCIVDICFGKLEIIHV